MESFEGQEELSGLTLKKLKTGQTDFLAVDGVFVAIGLAPQNERFSDNVCLDPQGYIASGEDCKTKTDGIFTAGDCRAKSVRQVTTAAADGAVSALAACNYIDSL